MPENVRCTLTEAFKYLLGLHPPGRTLREYARETIRKLAKRGNVIVIGRAGAMITANVRHVLHVRLIAPLDLRVRNYAQWQKISIKEAARAVRADDKANYQFVRSHFNTNVRQELHYDLVINTETNGFEGAENLVRTVLQDLAKKICPTKLI